jgi:succinate dehydrogenase/fumarate reductase flavoprotein subunit
MAAMMKRAIPITALFLDIGGVLLNNGWGYQARRRVAKHFNLEWAGMEERHRLTFDTHEEGKLAKRPFTRAQFRRFMFAQSKPYPEMIELLARQVLYIENTPMFVQVAEGLGIRSILHTDYKSTCAELASLGLENEGAIRETR